MIFGELEKYGNVWRLGADQATEITFNKDVKFGGQDVKAGTYTMFAIPGKTEWTIILNSVLGQWGAFSYDKTKDVTQISLPVKNLSSVVEQLTISIKPAALIIEWDQTQISIPYSVAKN